MAFICAMKILENHSLRAYNTFGVDARAAHFTEVVDVEMLREALAAKIAPLFVLGGGSNILLTRDLPGLVIHNAIRGIEVERETDAHVVVVAGGGTNWHWLVEWSLQRGLGGLENLSLIPGTVGAAPIQNIGAYGVELEDVFEKLEAYSVADGERVFFDAEACAFGYRDSYFKREGKGRFFITRVWLRLSKQPRLNLSYGNVAETLREMGISEPTIRDVSRAIIQIRRSKLPDPSQIGNAGSFFKNPTISEAHHQLLKQSWPDLPGYPLDDSPGMVKVPAGWLIEKAGWKGRRIGDAGCHRQQALVLVNYGKASGQDILHLARLIQEDVEQKFGIRLEEEVNVW